MSRRLKKLLLLFLTLLVIVIVIVMFYLDNFILQPIHPRSDNQLFIVHKGMTREGLAQRMQDEKLLDKAWLLPLYIRFNPELSNIKVGVYQLSTGMKVKDFLLLLNKGKEAQFSVQFAEGTRAVDWIKILQTAPMLKIELKENDSLKNMAEKIGIKSRSIEGWFYPDTYHYAPNSTDIDLLMRAYQRMYNQLQTIWCQRDDNLPYRTPYELLIMASLIEKETALENERYLVASVFINRLQRHMKLQADPTVIYGLGKRYKGTIRREDLQDKNGYNTYAHYGLPPTPIAMPSYTSLRAAAHPLKTEYLYFVSDGQGRHRFSSDLDNHNKAVAQYLKKRRDISKKSYNKGVDDATR